MGSRGEDGDKRHFQSFNALQFPEDISDYLNFSSRQGRLEGTNFSEQPSRKCPMIGERRRKRERKNVRVVVNQISHYYSSARESGREWASKEQSFFLPGGECKSASARRPPSTRSSPSPAKKSKQTNQQKGQTRQEQGQKCQPGLVHLLTRKFVGKNGRYFHKLQSPSLGRKTNVMKR